MAISLPMQSLQPASGASETGVTTLRARLEAGQTLSGSVRMVTLDSTRTDLFRIQVEVQNRLLEVVSNRPLDTGAQITLSRGADGSLQLLQQGAERSAEPRPLPGSPAATDTARPATTANPSTGQNSAPPGGEASLGRLQESLQPILRETLPRQLPLGDALNQLRQLGDSGRQGKAIGQLVGTLIDLFSVSSQPDGESTRQAIQNQLQSSGQQPPAAASGARPGVQEALAQLDRLAEQLPPQAREQMRTLLQGLKARQTVHQVAALQQWQEQPDGSQERQYRLDLPVQVDERQLENTEIRITERRTRNARQELVTEWSIRLHFELDALGQLDVRLSLEDGWRLYAGFWAEQTETAARIEAQLPALADQLRQDGFGIEALHVRQGQPPEEKHAAISQRLVDEHT